MSKTEYLVIYYIGHSWNKEEIMNALKLKREELEDILKKYNLKISKNAAKRSASRKRNEYAKKNVIIRNDKKSKECPFICVTVHKKLKTAKSTVYSLSIKDDGKKLRKRSKDLIGILKCRNGFLAKNNPEKLKQVRRIEKSWVFQHPFTKFTLIWFVQLFFKH